MKRNLCVLAIWWAFALGMSARDFVHPGGLHTLKDLARMKEKVKQKETPWIETWERLANMILMPKVTLYGSSLYQYRRNGKPTASRA